MELGRRVARGSAALLLAVTGVVAGVTGSGGAAQAQGDLPCYLADGCITIFDPIYPGESVYSANRRYRLTITANGDLQFRRGSTVLWSSRTAGKGAEGGLENHLVVQTDGNVVLYDEFGSALWASGSWDPDGEFFLKVQDDGKLIIYNGVTLAPLYQNCAWGRAFCWIG